MGLGLECLGFRVQGVQQVEGMLPVHLRLHIQLNRQHRTAGRPRQPAAVVPN